MDAFKYEAEIEMIERKKNCTRYKTQKIKKLKH